MPPKGNQKFLRRKKEIERQQLQEEKRKKRSEKGEHSGKGAGEDDVAAIQAAIDAGIDPRTLGDEPPAEPGETAEAAASDETSAET